MIQSYPIAIVAIMAAVIAAMGCGDPVAGLFYQGDPLATVEGQVLLSSTRVPTNGLYVVVGWRTESKGDGSARSDAAKESSPDWTGEFVDVSVGFPASYYLNVLQPPPAAALSIDPETGGRLGFAFVVLLEDVNRNGRLDVNQSDQGLPVGPDRFRGGSETLMLAYAADAFPAESRIGKALGTGLAAGYHLMQADQKYKCVWKEDRRDWTCPNPKTELRKVGFSTAVNLKVIDKPSEWAPVHAPDWLFTQ